MIMNKKKKSWRTTLFGAGGLLVIVASALSALFDGDPATMPQWGIVVGALSAAIGAFFARDNSVSSESAGAC